ncbi:MAG TPA: sterol desaturase family protein [Pyrinomonadaceae bacterium]|nr:sterol desaturase family protein [Pyrinomonadaceae bacterium]
MFVMKFIGLTIFGFVMMEFFSYAVHRWLFHGIFWRIHETHHVTRKGAFEANDIFTLVFSCGAIFPMIFAEKPLLESIAFPLGLGVAIYGFVYFIAHDFFTHRRFLPFKSKNKILLTIRAAHQKHHQSAEKQGLEPFGLFLFNYKKFFRK